MWLVARHDWHGSALSFANQFLWIAYALLTRQPGFVLGAAANGILYAHNLRRALRPKP